MESKHEVPGDHITTTTNVEPNHSPPPEGVVLPKVPFPLFWAGGIAVTVVILLFLVINSYYGIAQ